VFNYTRIKKPLYCGFIKKGDFFIATAEKALLDALYLMQLKRYSFDLTAIDFRKISKERLKKEARLFPEGILNHLKEYGST